MLLFYSVIINNPSNQPEFLVIEDELVFKEDIIFSMIILHYFLRFLGIPDS